MAVTTISSRASVALAVSAFSWAQTAPGPDTETQKPRKVANREKKLLRFIELSPRMALTLLVPPRSPPSADAASWPPETSGEVGDSDDWPVRPVELTMAMV